jgi:hypothetical protein
VTPAWKPYQISNASWPVAFNENAVYGDQNNGAFVYANYTSWEPVRALQGRPAVRAAPRDGHVCANASLLPLT